jgi:hypothetical protein
MFSSRPGSPGSTTVRRTRAETPSHSGGQLAGPSGISVESADATKGSGTR